MTDYERFSEYEGSERSTAGIALTFLFVGLAAGAVAALLLTPKSGAQLRKTLRRKYKDARDVLEDFGDQAGDVIDRSAEWANYAKEKAAPWGRTVARVVRREK
jgi:gas vesicle protein